MNSAPDPREVDVIIPVHDTRRPLGRAIASAASASSRVTVVCHEVDVDDMRGTLDASTAGLASWFAFSDGLGSPAGPKNFGLASTGAPWVVFLDSDDLLGASAVPEWLDFAERHRLDAVIAPERTESGRRIRTPPVRPYRRAILDAVKDRLLYRTAPLGMFRRSLIESSGARFTEGLATGEDLAFTARLWMSDARVGYPRGGPDYVVGEGGDARVTSRPRPIAEQLEPIDRLSADPWMRQQHPDARAAFAVRAIRGTVFSAVLAVTTSGVWSQHDAAAAAGTLEALEALAPGSRRSLSRADHALLDRLDARDPDSAALAALSTARRRFATPGAMLTREASSLLRRDAPMRFIAASLAL